MSYHLPNPMSSTTKPPVILQILPTLRSGGVERGTVEIASAITKQGWKSLVVSAGGPMVPQVNYVGGKHIQLPVDTKNPLLIWKNIHALEKVIREEGVNLIHARSRAPAWSAYYAAKRSGIPFMTTFHGVYGVQNSLKKKYNEVMVKGERVIAISNFIKEHIQSNYVVQEDRIRIVHRGVDLQLFDPAKVTSQRLANLMQEWRLPEDRPIIFVPGRFTRWKGQHVVLEALAKLADMSFYCVMAGDDAGHPNYVEELKQIAADRNLVGKILLTKSTPYMPEAYTLSDVVICPSVEPEAFGRVTVETQAMGKLIIATAHGGAMETIQDGVTGFLIAPNNADILAERIRFVLSKTREEKEEIGYVARNHVLANFTTENMCQQTMSIYWELLEK